MTISQVLARFVVQASHEQLAPKGVASAVAAISDCIGCMIAGAATPLGRITREVADLSSAPGAATMVGNVRGVSAQAAALANGAAAHALDYDDILWSTYGHPSAAILPAAMAIAEGVGASGSELLLAYAVGLEVAGKLGHHANPAHYEHGWHATGTLGVVGAAAACCKLLRLDESATAMALGIAASESCGVRRNFGTMTKPFHAGNAARGGVLAAELAQAGFTSDIRAFEGQYGWLHDFGAREVPSEAQLRDRLGKPWEIESPGIVLKRYPSCGATHCALDAFLALRSEYKFGAEDIERIVCEASPFAKKPLLYPRPVTGLEGKFSMEYCLALAAVEGQARLAHFEDAWVADPRIARMLPRISFEAREDLAPDFSADAVPAEVSVVIAGKVLSRQVRIPAGDPRQPMSLEQRRDKFLDCARVMEAADPVWLFEALENLSATTALTGVLGAMRRPATA